MIIQQLLRRGYRPESVTIRTLSPCEGENQFITSSNGFERQWKMVFWGIYCMCTPAGCWITVQWVFLLLPTDIVHRKVLSSGLESQKPPEWRTFSNFFTFGGRIKCRRPEIWQHSCWVISWKKGGKDRTLPGKMCCLDPVLAWGRERQFLPVLTLLYLRAPPSDELSCFAKFQQQMYSLFLFLLVCNDLPMSLHYPAALKWSQIIIQFPISHQRAESGWWNH